MKSSALAVAGIMVIGVTSATAQTPMAASRTFVAVNTGYQATSNEFRDGAAFGDYAEEGRFVTEYRRASGPMFDVAGSRQVWRWLGVGAGVHRFSQSTPATLTGSVPHPLFFNRHRSVGGNIDGLRRDELSLHAQLRGSVPVTDRVHLSLFGGPSWFRVRQGLVSGITYSEAYPYDEVFYQGEQVSVETASALGFNVGTDVAFFFGRQIGFGLSLQYAVTAGGVQTGGGLRLRF
jgi:hypothetical protein